MAILILNGGANAVGVPEDMHSCGRSPVRIRVSAAGGFSGDVVSLQHSPDSGVTWFPLDTLSNLQEVRVEDPFDWIRAVAGPAMTGTARVFVATSA